MFGRSLRNSHGSVNPTSCSHSPAQARAEVFGGCCATGAEGQRPGGSYGRRLGGPWRVSRHRSGLPGSRRRAPCARARRRAAGTPRGLQHARAPARPCPAPNGRPRPARGGPRTARPPTIDECPMHVESVLRSALFSTGLDTWTRKRPFRLHVFDQLPFRMDLTQVWRLECSSLRRGSLPDLHPV